MQIRFEGEQKNSSLNNNELFFQIANTSCGDAGLYTCVASNKVSTLESTTKIRLLVECKTANTCIFKSIYFYASYTIHVSYKVCFILHFTTVNEAKAQTIE